MSILEIIAIVFLLVCVYLTSKQNIWSWVAGMISYIAFFLLYLNENLYYQTGLQLVFFFQAIYGWYTWKNGKDGNELPVTSYGMIKIAPLVRAAILMTLLLVLIFVEVPKLPDYLDAVSTGLALLATWFLTQKKIEAWVIWMGVNIILFTLMLHQGLYAIAGLEVILFIISFSAFLSWKKDLKRDYV